jgi:type I restriction enzyme S subunit
VSLTAYPSYRDSGVPWLGQVPAHWTTARVKDCFRIVNGATPRSDVPEYWDGDVVWVTPADLSGADGWHIASSQRSLSTAGLEACAATIVPPGSIIVSTRAPIGSIGIAAVPLCTNQGCRALVPHPGSETRFHAYALTAFTPQLNLHGRGTTFLELSGDALGAFPVCAPPPAEQRAIAAFLDRECGKMDALVAEQERLIALLKEKRQAVISHAVTKGLDPTAPMKDSGVAWLGQVPAHWEVKRLKFVATVQTGVAKGRELSGTDVIEVPYLRVANVQDGYIDLDDVASMQIGRDELNRYALQAGDVLMNEGGDFDKLGRGQVWEGQLHPCIHQNHVFAVRPHSVEPEWLALITTADCGRFFFMSRSKQSTNLASISSSNLMELPLCVPPKAERQTILSALEFTMARLDEMRAESERAIALLKERRAALISAAVTGKIDVRGLAAPTEAKAA